MLGEYRKELFIIFTKYLFHCFAKKRKSKPFCLCLYFHRIFSYCILTFFNITVSVLICHSPNSLNSRSHTTTNLLKPQATLGQITENSPTNIYLFKVSNRNIRKRCEMTCCRKKGVSTFQPRVDVPNLV